MACSQDLKSVSAKAMDPWFLEDAFRFENNPLLNENENDFHLQA